MSLARQIINDMRPLFRVLEEPFSRPGPYYGSVAARSLFDDPFFQPALRPNIDVTEEGPNYIVEADLPGVKKENVEVRVGDGGHSVTIEGRIFRRSNGTEAVAESQAGAPAEAPASEGMCEIRCADSTCNVD